MSPATLKADDGEVVPIPMFPDWETVRLEVAVRVVPAAL
jgi:hypothetical protein